MRFSKKYLNPIWIYLIVYAFGFVSVSIGNAVARYAYAYMNYLFPKVFPLFSAVSEKEGYHKYLMLLCALGVFIAIFITNYLALRIDNAKFELMIKKTDGQYTLTDGAKLFFGEFGISELIVTLVLPLILVIPPFFIPEIDVQTIPIAGLLIDIMEKLLWLGYTLREYFSIVNAIALVLIFSLVARAAVIPGALKKWRASWLSGATE